MDLFCDPSIFDDPSDDKSKPPPEKLPSKDFDNFVDYVPAQRETNWFLSLRKDEVEEEVDCTDHPDKYVQQGTVWNATEIAIYPLERDAAFLLIRPRGIPI